MAFLLTRSLMYEYLSNSQWKNNFIVPIHWSHFLHDTEDALAFFYKVPIYIYSVLTIQI